jgi:serine/threonine-protein kinase
MNRETRQERTALPLDVLGQIDRICNRFEATWEAGQRPRLEDYLGEVAEPYQPDLLCDLLAAELDARRRRGERPEPHEYRDRFPGETAVVVAAFAAPTTRPPRMDARPSPPSQAHRCPSCKAELPLGGRFCPGCGHALAAPGETTASVRVREDDDVPGVRRHSSASPPLASTHPGQLLPGTKIADRYRIVALLGRGGMGEVYRADDLRLGHPVALKFLPKDLAEDPRRLQAFHDEVRLARQVSHPNACRVHDIGEVEGRHFLSMEYIDGEDLGGLLRRIGALPRAKGIEIAQQLCRGLAAAHERGVLHRDLKPANIMLDGRGQVRITDYGLARSIGDGDRPGEVAGTPAYMAPEQLARGEASIQSDLYSLGLVLYEVFTGRRVYASGSLAELMRAHEESSIAPPSSLVDDMDPAVERVILRCLEKDPRDRPRSARAVAAALPGGDPLAAAVAAGETPTPGMVAAAGETAALPLPVTGACLAGTVAGLFLTCLLAQWTMLVNRAPLELPPDALAVKAREIIKRLGYADSPARSASGFDLPKTDREAVARAKLPPGVTDRWDLLKTGPWPGLRFWYRQSPEPMMVSVFWNERAEYSRTRITDHQPPWDKPGMTGVLLDPRGRLRWFRAVPRPGMSSLKPPLERAKPTPPRSGGPVRTSDPTGLPWSDWFREEELGFSLEPTSDERPGVHRLSENELQNAAWLRTPPDAYDHMAAWEGTWPGSDEPLRVEATSYRGQPVYFEVLPPAFAATNGTSSVTGPQLNPHAVDLVLLINIVLLGGQVLLAWRNLRLGRGDRRGALRVAWFLFFVNLLAWMLRASHVGGLFEWALFTIGLAQALLSAALAWLLYIAIEPFVRRYWPQTLISWTRLLRGHFRDPRVGRDLLVGATAGVITYLLLRFSLALAFWVGLPSGLELVPLENPVGMASLFGGVLEVVASDVSYCLALLLMLLLLRIVLRSVRLAACGYILINSTVYCLMVPEASFLTWICIGLAVALSVWILIRLGLLASVVGTVVLFLQSNVPVTPDSSAFYYGQGMLMMGLVFAVALYGAFTSLAGRPLFRDA